ncbi:MAG: hypothetical protein LBK66_11475 [Spirochaetaceae bacterium]|jgi:hypothetical protein|nr:hypothetical protein [Spirochaetaceae bacterium]
MRRKTKLLITLLAGFAVLAAGGVSAVFIFSAGKSLPVWLVEESLAEKWSAVLDSAKVPPPFKDIEIYQASVLPKGRYGYIITTNISQAAGGNSPEAMVKAYPNLAASSEYEGSFLLALDPWAFFFEFTDPPPSRDRVEGNGELMGLLAGPGGEPKARVAWLSQLLQEEPGVFPQGKEFWEAQGNTLFQSPRFQPGALTYNWTNSWDIFLANKPSWIYAPLSMARNLRPSQSAGFAAARFPEKPGWTRYGIQAELLWAVPFGDEEQAQTPGAAAWLKDGSIQTLIANTLRWIPAVPGGTPFNAFSRTVQLNWLGSAFVWEDLRR